MSRVEKSIEIDQPVRVVYDRWTQFEEFPRFMEGVEEVFQLDDKTLHWRARIGGKAEEWDAEIVRQVRDQLIAWRHPRGAIHAGVVSFIPVDAERCRVTLALEYDPGGFIEKAGDILGAVSRRVEGDLERFENLFEERLEASDAWRREVGPESDVEPHPQHEG